MKKKKSNSNNKIIRSHKIKIYPNEEQQAWLKSCSDYERYCWNRVFGARNNQYSIYRSHKKSNSLSKEELNLLFPNKKWLRKNIIIEDWEQVYHCRFKEIAVERVEQAIANCFNSKMPNHKFPKFKKKKDFDYPKVTFRGVKIVNKKIILPKSKGDKRNKSVFRIKCAENLRFDGDITQDQTISFDGKNWWITFSVEIEKTKKKTKVKNKIKTGVDVNIGKFNFMDIDKEFKEIDTIPNELLLQYSKIKFYSRKLNKKRKKQSKLGK